MAIGLGVALPLDLAIGSIGGGAGLVLARYGTAPVVAVGLLGAVARLSEARRPQGVVQRRLAEVGRAALSSYVLQNLLCSLLCYGWGLGLAASMGEARTWWTLALYPTVCALVIAVIAGAHLWLRQFQRGPLESIWAWAYEWPERRSRRGPGEAAMAAGPVGRCSESAAARGLSGQPGADHGA